MPPQIGRGYSINTNPNARRICATISLPGDQESISNFIGALSSLSLWYNYQRDLTHKGRVLAAVWREIVEGINFTNCSVPPVPDGGCGDDCMGCCLRFNDDGVLEQLSCGVWEPVPGAAAFAARVNGATQPSPQGDLELGDCYDADVVLYGSNVYNLPIGIAPGYVVTITAASGGWSDGTPFGPLPPAWACPDGSDYAFGLCGAAGIPFVDDPAPDLAHMRMVYQLGSTWGDAYNASFTVPLGSDATSLQIQANDVTLANNLGSIKFHINVCNQELSTWTSTFDFSVSSYTGIINIPYGNFVSGSGIEGVPNGSTQLHTFVIELNIPTRTLKSMSINYSAGGGSGPSQSVQFGTTSGLYGIPSVPGSGSNLTYTQSADVSTDYAYVAVGSGSTDAQVIAKSWTVTGYGTKPPGLP